MRARLLALVLAAATLAAGCTAPGNADDAVRTVAGVAPGGGGDVAVTGERGVAVEARNGTLVVGLASAAVTDVVRACSTPCPALEVARGTVLGDGLVSLHNVSLNADGPDGDAAVYFYENGIETGRFLRWSDVQDRFLFNDDVLAVGNVTATHHVGTTTPLTLDRPGNPVVTVSTAATEGLEVTIFARGSARLANGTVDVPLPEAFQAILGEGALTVQVTLTSPGPALMVTQKERDRFRVQTADGTGAIATFDWFVQGVRRGTEDFTP